MSVIRLDASPVPMTEEQRFVFDLKGWILLPGVLEPSLLKSIREYLRGIVADKARHGRYFPRLSIHGPAQHLVDHPAIVGILTEIIADGPTPDAYGFRCESSFFVDRPCGHAGFLPAHCGPIVGPLAYRVLNGRIWSGLTRVVWELSDVRQPEGGTPIMSGSHKASFDVPAAYRKYDPALYEGYCCPAGSAIIMSESCWHYGVEWQDPSDNRLAVFNCYNSYVSQWHKMNLDPNVVAAMPLKRQTAFRGVWATDVRHDRRNDYYAANNQAL